MSSVGRMPKATNTHGYKPSIACTVRLKQLLCLLFALLTLVSISGLLPTAEQAHAFGTINGAGQRAEHERITRAALACPPQVKSTGDCFEPRSIDQLAGHTGTFGAVGAPDSDETLNSDAHCDDADFLNVPGYPRTIAQRDAALSDCVNHFRTRFQEGIRAADGLLDGNNELIGKEVDLKDDCTFFAGISGRAKCNAIEGLGRALHGAQDFYAHSNWTDQTDPTRPISIQNPPGLNASGPSPILDLIPAPGSPVLSPPTDFSAGRFVLGLDQTGCPASSTVTRRVTHACMNKDEELIDPVTGSTTDPQTPRGRVLNNAQNAVSGAITETRRQWSDFRAKLVTTYGTERGGRIIRALTQDVPKVDVVFAIDTTGSMTPYIESVVESANRVVDELSGRGPDQRLSDFRVGIVDYKDVDSEDPPDCPPDYDAVLDLPFSTVRADVVNGINELPSKVEGGCDIPEDVASGIKLATDQPWRDGVKKTIIVMGDAPGHDPEAHSGLTLSSVVDRANALDPVLVFAILVGSDSDASLFMSHLAEGTGGSIFDSNSSNVGKAVLDAISMIVSSVRPTTAARLSPAPSGDGSFDSDVTVSLVATASPAGSNVKTITFSASGAQPVDSTTVSGAAAQLVITTEGETIVTFSATDEAGDVELPRTVSVSITHARPPVQLPAGPGITGK